MDRSVRQRHPPETRERWRIRIRPAYIILVVLMGLFAYKFVEKTQELRQLTREANALRIANQQTLQENERIGNAIRYYHTDQYIEQQARSLFGYTKPGEVAIMTKPRYQHVTVRAEPIIRTAPPDPTWKQWWHALFG